MLAHTQFQLSDMTDTELFAKIQLELVNRYQINPQLASEMAWDLLEVMAAVDGNLDIFEKYFLQ